MIKRNSDRDTWKHWDEYIAGCNFSVPKALDAPEEKGDFIVFKNNNDDEFEESMRLCVEMLES